MAYRYFLPISHGNHSVVIMSKSPSKSYPPLHQTKPSMDNFTLSSHHQDSAMSPRVIYKYHYPVVVNVNDKHLNVSCGGYQFSIVCSYTLFPYIDKRPISIIITISSPSVYVIKSVVVVTPMHPPPVGLSMQASSSHCFNFLSH